MKTASVAALAAIAGSAAAGGSESTFAVLRFNNKQLVRTREDPIVAYGKAGSHVHTVFGSSGFSMNATAEDLANGDCTTAMIKGDMSAYWAPQAYFRDPKTKMLEAVDIHYANVYYFFDKTDDEIKSFPKGLKIVGGDPWTRSAPSTSYTNLGERDDVKDIQNVKWTCPRLDQNYSPASWHADSDGSDCGEGDPVNKGEGVGFPDVTCDGYASPLRADVHMPSCYNPKAGLDDYANNMAFPKLDKASGKWNCEQGWIHVPHLFYEVYWDTLKFQGKWTEGQKEQPFVLSNGDITGFSSHADFMSAWDEDVLQDIIDNCNAGTEGMDKCPGVTLNHGDCTIESNLDEDTQGPFAELPGNNPFLGWSFGTDGLEDLIPDAVKNIIPSKGSDGSSGLPDVDNTEGQAVENAEQKEKPKAKPAPKPAAEPQPEPELEVVEEPTTSCEKKIHTVMETKTVTEEVVGEPTEMARRHLHGHQHGHHRRNFH